MLAKRELIPQALPGLQRKVSTRLTTIHRIRPIFRGISRYLTTSKPLLLVCCALFASEVARLEATRLASERNGGVRQAFASHVVIQRKALIGALHLLYWLAKEDPHNQI